MIAPPPPKAVVLTAMAAFYALRLVYAWRSLRTPVAERRVGFAECGLLQLAKIALVLPVVWALTPLLDSFDYALPEAVRLAGLPLLLIGLWYFYRSHADLGDRWSPTLELKQGHCLVTTGVYRHVRHPMYLACLVFGAGLAMSLPNLLAGPALLLAMLLLVFFRLPTEEQMLHDHFGEAYQAYRKRTWRLLPGAW